MIDLKAIKAEYDSLTQQLRDPELISQWEKFQEISKKRVGLEKIISKLQELEEIQKKMEENTQIVTSQEDEELSSLAHQEFLNLGEQKKKVEKELEELATKKSFLTPSALILEIRPGTGGEEAALFARDLLEMYLKYAQNQGWKQTILNLSDTDLGGVKEASLEVKGEETFDKLQYEGGVHRVQRIPETEKSGRVHTSTASVAVLQRPTTAQIQLNPNDLEIEFYNASGPGGQNVNKRKTAVRIVHKPTGLVASSQTSKSQQTNKEYAIALLEAKLLEQKESALEKELATKRKTQIGWAKRAEKIRTYNFPQDRVTDHRIEQSWHGIEKIMAGELDSIVEALQKFQSS